MDFSRVELDADTIAWWHDLNAYLDVHVGEDVREHEWRTGDRHNQAAHEALAARGLIAPSWPVEEGGAGLDAARSSIVEAELQARDLPRVTRSESLITVVAVRAHGTPELQAEVIPKVARGELRMTLGWTEPDCGSDIAAARTRATRSGDGWLINGAKLYSTGAHKCTHSFVLVRTNPDVSKHKGLSMFLCPLQVPGVEIQAIRTLGGERTNAVFFDDVYVDDFWRVGDVDDGWRVLQAPLAADQGALHARRLETEAGVRQNELGWALDGAIAWARRPAPDGRAPIDDPVTRARLARAELDLEVAAVAAAGPFHKIYASESMIRDAADLLDLVGADGYLTRGDPDAPGNGAVEHAHRFSPGTAIYSGTNDIHRTMIAERVLGLPRSRPADRRT
jgi:alkylation response protein AidB-like acyl-CoA dehydrogenase